MNPAEAAPEARARRIICVEDDPLIADILRDLLSRAGYLVGVIAHGTVAYEAIAFKQPDLVILDRSLPGLGGIAILQRLRQRSETYLIPILMLTASGGDARIDEGLEAGADGYLVKPFDPDMLLGKVASILTGSLFTPVRGADRRI